MLIWCQGARCVQSALPHFDACFELQQVLLDMSALQNSLCFFFLPCDWLVIHAVCNTVCDSLLTVKNLFLKLHRHVENKMKAEFNDAVVWVLACCVYKDCSVPLIITITAPFEKKCLTLPLQLEQTDPNRPCRRELRGMVWAFGINLFNKETLAANNRVNASNLKWHLVAPCWSSPSIEWLRGCQFCNSCDKQDIFFFCYISGRCTTVIWSTVHIMLFNIHLNSFESLVRMISVELYSWVGRSSHQ